MADNDDLDLLFEAPLDEFIGRRNELAIRLKTEGDADASKTVKALRKPALSAWVVNQLARSHADDIRALVAAGEEIEDAQRRTLSGERVGFESARRDENAAIQRLRAAASVIVPSITAATIERVTTSLMAGARSAEGRASLVEGRLTNDLEPPGFGTFGDFTVTRAPADDQPVEREKPEPEPGGRDDETVDARRRELASTVRSAADSAAKAETKAKDAEAKAANAEQESNNAATRANDLERKAEAAAAKAKDAAAEAREAKSVARTTSKHARALRGQARQAAESLRAAEEALAALSDED